MKPGEDNGVANYEYYRLMFGEPGSLEENIADIEQLVCVIEDKKLPMPRLYLACGEQDFLRNANRDFVDFLKGHEVDFCYHEGEGEHNFTYWNRHLEPGIRWMLKEGI